MSTCDTCRKPGACCKGFVLNRDFFEGDWREEATALMARHGLEYFQPVRARPRLDGQPGVTVYFDCQRLGADGRCTQYEDRPYTCQQFRAGSEPLCAEYVHKLRGIPIVVAPARHAPAPD